MRILSSSTILSPQVNKEIRFRSAAILILFLLVDAHVGKALFADAILGALRNKGKTVILVTHALHFLSQCDYVYMLENGSIEEQGTFQGLLEQPGKFARLMNEFGGQNQREEEEEEAEEAIEGIPKMNADIDEAKLKAQSAIRAGTGTGKLEGRLIVAEKRTTGSVGWSSMYSDFVLIFPFSSSSV